MIEFEDQIKGAVFGLAFGDSIGAPSATNRLSILAPKRIMRMRSLLEYADEKKQTTRPFPYTHAQPEHSLKPSPSDDVEWFAFVLGYLSQEKSALEAWLSLAQDYDEIRARTGTKIALKNLKNGLLPPISGHDNPHYFDDIALVRAAAIALMFHKDINQVNNKIRQDITVTHSEDGIYCALAFANLIVKVLQGSSKSEAIESALETLPIGSWSARLVSSATYISKNSHSNYQRALTLEDQFVEKIYAYPISAPETLGLLLAHFENTDTPENLFNSSLLHKRQLDSLPPLAGLLAGVLYGYKWLPSSAVNPEIAIDGVCIPKQRGITLGDLTEALIKKFN